VTGVFGAVMIVLVGVSVDEEAAVLVDAETFVVERVLKVVATGLLAVATALVVVELPS
jgi:hypothetical protein